LLVALAVAGCAVDDGRFFVTSVEPPTGEVAYPSSTVWVAFSDPPDPLACADAFTLAAMVDGVEAAWVEPLEVVPGAGTGAWTIDHDPLTVGMTYALVVAAGPGGCRSVLGEQLEPFSTLFQVVERADL
jgi:hypothetical protein